MRALVVEDDPAGAEQLRQALTDHGFAVDIASNGRDGWFLGDTESYDIAILDLGLPERDGLSILSDWRQAGNNMLVLVLTARDTWREKVSGLRAGADDYLVKPYETEELLARVEALVRRAGGHSSPVIKCGALELDPASQRITREGRYVVLSALEYRLVAYLMYHQQEVVSKSTLTEHLYDQDFDHDSNVIEVLVNRVRKKLGSDYIRTRRGQGYQLNAG